MFFFERVYCLINNESISEVIDWKHNDDLGHYLCVEKREFSRHVNLTEKQWKAHFYSAHFYIVTREVGHSVHNDVCYTSPLMTPFSTQRDYRVIHRNIRYLGLVKVQSKRAQTKNFLNAQNQLPVIAEDLKLDLKVEAPTCLDYNFIVQAQHQDDYRDFSQFVPEEVVDENVLEAFVREDISLNFDSVKEEDIEDKGFLAFYY